MLAAQTLTRRMLRSFALFVTSLSALIGLTFGSGDFAFADTPTAAHVCASHTYDGAQQLADDVERTGTVVWCGSAAPMGKPTTARRAAA